MITTAMNHSEPIDLGRQGENLARTIDIDISAWRAEYGEGTVQLLHQRPGDSTPYPAAVEQAGDVVRWAITAADTARVGYGAAQLLFYAGDVLAKQCIYRTYVSPSLGQSAGEPPEAQQPWVERVLAEAAKVTGMTARAVELPAGADPTADYADGILTIGIPLGDVSEAQVAQAVADYLAAHPIQESDPTVPAWAKAAHKPSYTASEVGAIAQTELQSAVDTALAQAKASGAFDGADGATGPQGEQGPQGIQGETGVGIQSVVQTTEATEDGGTNVITVTKTDGTTSTFAVRNGSTGPAGADGKSAYQYAQDGGYTGTQEEFAAKLAEEMPTALPNPNALTFTGAVTASYDGSAPLEVEIPSGGGASGDYIPIPQTAAVGQTIVVKAVDENAKPTEWEAVDMASGGGEKPWRYDKLIEFSEDTAGFTLDTFDDGSPFDFTEIEVRAALKNASEKNVWGDLTVHSDGTNENSVLQSIGGDNSSISVFTNSGTYYLCLIQGYIDISAKTIHGIINANAGTLYINSSKNLESKLSRQDVNYVYGLQGKPNAWKIAPTKLTRVTSSMQIGAGSYVWVRGR